MVTIGIAGGAVRAGADEEDAGAARDHYRKGLKLYDLLHYPEAALEFEAAYQAKSDPAFLYNIAQAHRLAGDKEKAIGSYRSYLRRLPTAKNAPEVEQRIAELQKLIDEERRVQRIEPAGTLRPSSGTTTFGSSATAAEPRAVEPGMSPPGPANQVGQSGLPQSTAPSQLNLAGGQPPVVNSQGGNSESRARPGFTKEVIGGVLLGVGVAAAATGIVFGVQASSALNQANHPAAGQVYDPNLQNTYNTDRALSIGLLVAGGAVAVTGAVVLVLGIRQSRRPAVTLVPVVAPNGAGAAAFFRF